MSVAHNPMNSSAVRRLVDFVTVWIGPIALALLAYVGQFKGNPLLSWIPFDLTVIAAVVVALASVLARYTQGPAHWTIWVAVAVLASLLLGLPQSNFQGYALTKIATLYTVTLICIVAPFYTLRSERQRRIFLIALGAVCLTISAVTLVFPAHEPGHNEFIFAGTNTIGTARIAATGLLILVVIAVGARLTFARRIGCYVAAAIPFVALLASGSRGPLIGAILGLGAALMFTPLFRRARLYISIVFALGTVVLIAWLATHDIGTRLWLLFDGQLGISADARLSFWREAIDHIQVVPWGTGWGSFADISSAIGKGTAYPHNLILGIALEAGWLAGLVIIAYITCALLISRRVAVNITLSAFFGLLIFAILNSLVSGDINDNRLMWILLSCAVLMFPHRQSELKEPPHFD